MADPLRKEDRRYTYKDYRQWPEEERYELIDGVAYQMSAPTSTHQAISMELGVQLHTFLKGKPCRVFAAPFDVLLPPLADTAEDDVDTVVQPDLVVICDQDRIKKFGLWGAPDLAVEILSPSTSGRDLRVKFNLYQRLGVKEYWVIDPPGRWVHQYVRQPSGLFGPQKLFVDEGTLVSPTLEGLEVDIATLWPDF